VKYKAIDAQRTRCGHCDGSLTLLTCAGDTPGMKLPAFYVCFCCASISQIGAGVVVKHARAANGPGVLANPDGPLVARSDCPDCHTEAAHDVRCGERISLDDPRAADPKNADRVECEPDDGPNGPLRARCEDISLKNCPGCGEHPTVDGEIGGAAIDVGCTACGIHVPTMRRLEARLSWDAVVDAWNGGFATAESK